MTRSNDSIFDFLDEIENPSSKKAAEFNEKDAVKFDMYIKLRELKQISQGFQRLNELPQTERVVWLTDHELFLSEMMETFLNDTLGTIDGVHLDTEALELSVELVTTMRDTMNMMRSIMHRPKTS